jgi:hypothetical protein
MADDWFCEIAGRELGPLSSQQLKTMAAKGQILPSDCVHQGAAGKWVPSGQVKGLFPPRQDAGQTAAGQQPPVAPQPPHPSSPKTAQPSPPAVPRIARPIVLPKAQAAQQPPDAPQPASTPEFPDVTGAPMFDLDSEPAGHSYAPPAHSGKSIAARAHAKRKQQQQQLLAGSLVLVVVGVVIAGIFLALGGPVKFGEVGGGGLTDLPKQLEKAAAAKSADEKFDASDARKDGDRAVSGKSKKPVKDDGRKVKPTDKPGNAQQKPADVPKPANAARPDEKNEKPADKADDGKWVDASMSPAVVNDIPVQVLSAAQKPGKAGAAGGDLLIVTLQVKNPSRLYTMEFAGWSREAAQKGVVMTDDQGKSYPAQSIDTTAFLVKPLPVTVKPYELVKDVLAFEAPGPKVKFLRLELSATAFGKIGTANLKIPVRMITGAPAVAESTPAKPPETAPPATPPPKKERPAPRPGTPEADFGIDPDDVPKD